mmetsp:Transcript_4156/g.6611  ORF Transcript_4156/g.6611 Transcript_4156/m.6611 type:complete len:348 (-) Transcript_4156:125-1168(-)|eukprot:CAMPEP_0174970922 /NCGR_PEP_ID=MMETSP0004_2-20121128/9691_1 /TAXON_ID=420556 /ORGANISM="Ochromonas sp., Strain CCMP1393" /LENGTH=347 /DNA_ID=CAMNT_0016220785 /DNA_START=37 /DNA_END=1080 /DNA_ORIENTATION=-
MLICSRGLLVRLPVVRHCAFSSSSKHTQVFDRSLKHRQREYALKLGDGDYYDYLREESASNIVDRIEDITRTFPNALELGSYRGHLLKMIGTKEDLRGQSGGVGGIQRLTQCDIVDESLLGLVGGETECTQLEAPVRAEIDRLVQASVCRVDEESSLPFDEDQFDLVLSSLSLHWVNNLPQTLLNIKQVLKPDGAFIGSMVGGDTLKELRYCFYLAEQERRGGISSHASPVAKASDVAGLMQGAGFSLPTVDIDTITISYPDAITLMEHLVHMGEGSASFNRQFHVGRDTFLAMASIYQEMFGLEDGSVPATFEIIYMIGWKPHESQQQACKRGSAQVSMKDIGRTP